MKPEEQKSTNNQDRNHTSADDNKAKVTHNLDTGRDEPLNQRTDDYETPMDFAPGSGGGSAGDGGAA